MNIAIWGLLCFLTGLVIGVVSVWEFARHSIRQARRRERRALQLADDSALSARQGWIAYRKAADEANEWRVLADSLYEGERR